ncbi:MAG TPA: ThiF family adenylyltransferase [Acidimicrobiales bacterium]|nr:ThiF family adenylyltransferase [Acidimicrobiales bacterium]
MVESLHGRTIVTVRGLWRKFRSWLAGDRRNAERSATPGPTEPSRRIEIRITVGLFDDVRYHVENFTRGEEAGFLICSINSLDDRDVLLGTEWHPIPEGAMERNSHGSVLSWSAAFNSDVLQRAVSLNATAVLVHSHGDAAPEFSSDDRRNERALFGAFSRLLDPVPTGTLLLGRGHATGSFWRGGQTDGLAFERVVIVGPTIESWYSSQYSLDATTQRRRLNRQTQAIGPESDAKLRRAQVAIVGVSGGGSHVFQQLAHQGVGTLIPVDDQVLDETNLGRHVGAIDADVDHTLKVAIAHRLASGVDADILVVEVPERFPSAASIAALKQADIVVACLDRFDAREDVNAFCRRYMIPLIDVGISIRSSGEHLALADGQVIVSLPGHACLRCFFVTDAILEWERREHPAGYDDNPAAPGQPQVVSMNGVLASEACNCVLDLITGYSGGRRGARQWQYDGRTGELQPSDLPPRREDCPACAQEGLGDPVVATTSA